MQCVMAFAPGCLSVPSQSIEGRGGSLHITEPMSLCTPLPLPQNTIPYPAPSLPHPHCLVSNLTGARVLKAMHGQRETMKSAHRKVLDVLNSTGLSDSLLRVADRRQRTDATLVYGGMLAVVALTFLAWRWSMRRAHGGGGGGGGGINDGQHGGGYHLMGGGGLGAAEHHFAAGSGS